MASCLVEKAADEALAAEVDVAAAVAAARREPD